MLRLASLLSVLMAGCVLDGGRSYSALYEGCAGTSDCAHGVDACFTVSWEAGRGGMCSTYCDVDADCGGWAACYALTGDPSATLVCYARCTSDRDCAPGFTCAEAVREGRPVDDICLPQ